MRVLVDDRIGSAEFKKGLTRLLPDAMVTVKRLPCADFQFTGNGPAGPVTVGVERKTVSEMVGTASRKRFTSGQLPKMLKAYGPDTWLLIEGHCEADRWDGLLTAGKYETGFGPGSRMLYDHWIMRRATLLRKSRVMVVCTRNKTETARAVVALYRWYQKPWKAHKSAYAVEEQTVDSVIFTERTWRRQVLAQFPGVGWERSKKAARHFGSVHEAVMAGPLQWQEALGFKKCGKVCHQLVARLRGKDDKGDGKG